MAHIFNPLEEDSWCLALVYSSGLSMSDGKWAAEEVSEDDCCNCRNVYRC